MPENKPLKLKQAMGAITEGLTLSANFEQDIYMTFDKGNWIQFSKSFDGVFSTPYAGRKTLTSQQAEPHANDLLPKLQQWIPDSVQTSQNDLLTFWAKIIGNDDLGDQLLDSFNEIKQKIITAEASPTLHILEAIEKFLVEKAGQKNQDNNDQAKEMINLLASLNFEARTWLETLLLKMYQQPELLSQLKHLLRGYLWKHVQHDDRHYLLFGQTAERIVPRTWIEASWDYIERFRCNFGFFVTEAMLYDRITIVGTPDIAVPVKPEEEDFLRSYLPKSYRIERLWVKTADELKQLLDERINDNECFAEGDVGPHAPKETGKHA